MLAIDLGGTRVKAGVVRDGVVHGLVAVEHGASTLAEALACVDEIVARLVPDGCAVAGLCVPGLVDDDRVVALPGKLQGAVGADLVGWLSARTGGRVFVVNDAAAYGVGEAAGEPGRTVVMTLGTGVGVAVVENGRPLGLGPLGGGVLGGQLPLTADGPVDTAGRAGTVEAWCRASRLRAEGLTSYRQGLARAVAALCLAYGPRLVVVGGGPVQPDGSLLDGLSELVAPLLWSGQTVTIRGARHGDAAALLGLAVLA